MKMNEKYSVKQICEATDPNTDRITHRNEHALPNRDNRHKFKSSVYNAETNLKIRNVD